MESSDCLFHRHYRQPFPLGVVLTVRGLCWSLEGCSDAACTAAELEFCSFLMHRQTEWSPQGKVMKLLKAEQS